MMKKPMTTKAPVEQVVKDIRRAPRKLHSSEEKTRIVLSGLRGEDRSQILGDFPSAGHIQVFDPLNVPNPYCRNPLGPWR